MRTFDRPTFMAAKAAWEDGEFGWQWQPIRRLAAERGFIYPPSGTRHDDREVESPSQRAIVWRALEDNPTELLRIVRRSRSWSEVVDQIIGLESRLRVDLDDRDREVAWDKADQADYRESVKSLAAILERIDGAR